MRCAHFLRERSRLSLAEWPGSDRINRIHTDPSGSTSLPAAGRPRGVNRRHRADTQNRDRPLDGCLKHPLGDQTAFEFLEHGGVRVDLWNRQVRRADARRRCHLVRDSPSEWTPPLEMTAIAHQTTAPCIWKPMQSNNTQTVHQPECACRPGLNGSVQQSPITGEA